MKDKKKYLWTFIAMAILMVVFIIYALNNPQGSFQAPLGLVFAGYLLYIFIMLYFLFKFLKK